MRILLAILSLVLALFLLPYGGYYLLVHSPFLFHSYTQISIFFVVIGVLLIVAAVNNLIQRARYDIGVWDLVASFAIFVLLIVGVSAYWILTSQVQTFNTSIDIVGKIPATTEFWTSLTHRFKPNQKLMIASDEPFHIRIGEVDSTSAENRGRYYFFIETTDEDYFNQSDYLATAKLSPNDRLAVKLTQGARQITADVGVGVSNEDHTSKINEARRIERNRLIGFSFFGLALTGILGYFGYRYYKDWLGRKRILENAEKAKKQRKEKEETERKRVQKENETREAEAKLEEANRLKKENEEKFEILAKDIDPDELFGD